MIQLYRFYSVTGLVIPGLYATPEEICGWDSWRFDRMCMKQNVVHRMLKVDRDGREIAC
jgi:hypothetical protein